MPASSNPLRQEVQITVELVSWQVVQFVGQGSQVELVVFLMVVSRGQLRVQVVW